jgi:UDP-glucose 4-epimerase
MKIIVSGGSGFIGSHIVDLYIKKGHDVVVIDNLSSGLISNLNPRAAFYKVDIRGKEVEEVFRVEKPDIVNHHAAQTNIQDSVQNSRLFTDVNILGTINLVEQAVRYNVDRFIFASSGLLLYGNPDYLPCDEEHVVKPTCQYAASKRAVEEYLQANLKNYGMEYTIFRYSNVYGPRQNPQGLYSVIAAMIVNMLVGETVTIYPGGEEQRDYIYIDDCAHANLLALNSDKSGIYNLGSGFGTTINTILTVLKSLTKYDFVTINTESNSGQIQKIYLDASKAQHDLGWQPSVDIFNGLEKTVMYYKNRITK